MRSGILVLDKKAGVTSFDAVALVRRRLGIRRVGHAGTLDPAATGVLPILTGEATKLVSWLVDQDKEYVATIRFGVTTDTHDLSGRVLAERAVPTLTPSALEEACRPFVGRIRQVPPMYSAVHHGGRRLYELAREGVEVEREPRDVVVHAIHVEEVGEATVTLRVRCGKGTYVRVLAADLGKSLGCGAAIERLVRTRVGPYPREIAVDWDALTGLPAEALQARLLPPESALASWARVVLDATAARRFAHGQAVEIAAPAVRAGTPVRVHEAMSGALLGVGEITPGAGGVRPLRLLNADRPGTRVLPA